MPKQVPPIAASKQRTTITTTAVVPPAAIKAPSSLTAAMVAFTALTVASATFFAVFAVALAVTLAECSAFLAAFAVTSALFFAASVPFCAVFICLDVFSRLLALCFIPASADFIVLSPERTLRISRLSFCFGTDCLRVRGLNLSFGLSSLTVFALGFVCCFLSATDFLATVVVPLARFSVAFLLVSVTLSVAYCSGEGLSSFETSCLLASSSVLVFAFDNCI